MNGTCKIETCELRKTKTICLFVLCQAEILSVNTIIRKNATLKNIFEYLKFMAVCTHLAKIPPSALKRTVKELG